jgi:hypothetical protein
MMNKKLFFKVEIQGLIGDKLKFTLIIFINLLYFSKNCKM